MSPSNFILQDPRTPVGQHDRRAGPILPLLLLAVTLSSACGGGDPAGRPPRQQGPFAQVVGARAATFSLASEDVDLECVPKPGLEELEYRGQDPASGNGLHLVFKEYAEGESVAAVTIEYDISRPQHVVDVLLGGGYRYRFFRHLRSDSDEIFNSRCSLTLDQQREGGVTRFSGHINCTQLFADTSSPDYAGASRMNAFVDLVARFECER